MSKKEGDPGSGMPTGVTAVNMTVGEVVIVSGFSGGYPVLTSKPISQITDPPVGPAGNPSETNVLQWNLKVTDTDVPLATPPTAVVIGSVFLIDYEYMTVVSLSNVDNPGVARATHGSVADAHAQGTVVKIWATPERKNS